MDDVSSGTGGQEGCELVQLEACAVMQQDDAGYLTLNDVSDYMLALLTSQSPQPPDLEHAIHAAQRRLVIVARLSVHSPAASCNPHHATPYACVARVRCVGKECKMLGLAECRGHHVLS